MALVRDAAYSFDERASNVLPLADSSVVWRHAALGLSGGRVRALQAGDVFAGFAGRAARSDRLATGAPPEQVPVISQGEVLLTISGVTASNLGAAVYATADDTFSLSSGSYIGRVVRVPDSGSAWVAFDAPNQAAGPLQGLVSGAVTRTLTLELATTDTILARMPDGRYIGTSNDTAGGFGGRLWVATGSPGALVKTGIAATNVVALKNSLGAVMGGGVVQCVWPLPSGDFLFSGADASSRCCLWYAKASGAGFTVGANASNDDLVAVLDVGRKGATHIGQVRALHERSMCAASLAGSPALLFGEYNVASGRVAGAAFDQCRVMRSNDQGKTWSTLLEWNTNGTSSQMRHVHGVRQDPETGYVYIMIGDNPWSSLIRWDGVSAAPPANTELSAFNGYPGWECLPGAEWYRSCDLLFGPVGAHYLIDNTDWGGFDKPMAVNRRGPLAATKGVAAIDIAAKRDPLIALALPDGGAIWLSMWDTSIGARGFDVWSSPDMRSWTRIGHIPDIGTVGTVGVLTNVFWAGGKIFVSMAAGSARLVSGAYGGTLIFNADSAFSGTPGALA